MSMTPTARIRHLRQRGWSRQSIIGGTGYAPELVGRVMTEIASERERIHKRRYLNKLSLRTMAAG